MSLAGRVMIVGLDGATWQLARPWAEAGRLPAFRRLMREGTWGALESVMPPVTPSAWSSFATGMNPGKHGLFDFLARRDGTYEMVTANASFRDGAALWQLAGAAGRRVTVFNVPATYPPDRVNGLMVSGFLTPAHAADAAWPPELQAELRQAVPGFTFYPPNVHTPGREREFADSISALNRATLEAVRYLLRRAPWDLFVAVFMGVDLVQHFLWSEMERAQADASHAILQVYQEMDAALGELLAGLTPDDYLLVMSDHGFGPLTHYFHVNAWLVDRGYLAFKRTPVSLARSVAYRLGLTPLEVYEVLLHLGLGRRIQTTASEVNDWMKVLVRKLFVSLSDVDWNRTRAYSVGFGGPIFVNLRGREPGGIVAPGAECERLLEELTADLRRLVDPLTGQPFVGRIYRRDELYQGPQAGRSPDLIFLPRNASYQSFGMHEFASHHWLMPSYDRSGTHRMDGLLALHGPGVRPGFEVPGAAIVDVAPTVLALMGVPIPQDLDGRVLAAAFDGDWLAEREVAYTPDGSLGARHAPAPDYSPEDQALIERHLQDLGYIA